MTNENKSQVQDSQEKRPSALVVLPVYNEEKAVRNGVETLLSFLNDHNQFEWKVVIADNNSNDRTAEIGRELESDNPIVNYLHIPRKGRGIALRTAWEQADTDYVSYMDIDLSTGLDALIKAIDALVEGADIAVGTRLSKESNTTRSLKREFISRSYNIVIKMTLGTHFNDAHCGFKTGRREVVQKLLPYIDDNEWFLDTELLFYAEKLGHKIVEIPVTWIEDTDTKAKIFKDAYDDLSGLYRLRFHNNLTKTGERT